MNVISNLPQFNSALASYIAAHQGRKGVREIMQKKGQDLGIKLYQAFAEHKWGGAGKAQKNLARAELDARAATGKGIKVRRSIMQAYLGERSKLRDKQKGKSLTGRRIEARARLWQKFVGKELSARQRGIGVLAAAFLWFRKRSSQSSGTYFVKNRSGKYNLGYAVAGEDSFQIVADVTGSAQVDAKYGIVDRALSEATADIEKYFMDRPQYWRFWQTFNALEAAK